MLTQAREMGVEELQDTITGTTVEHQKAAGAKEVAKAPKINKAIQSPETNTTKTHVAPETGATRSWGRMALPSATASM